MIVNDELNATTGVRTVTTITADEVTVTIDGVTTETRAPTADELASLTPPEPAPTAEERIAELEAVIAALLEAP